MTEYGNLSGAVGLLAIVAVLIVAYRVGRWLRCRRDLGRQYVRRLEREPFSAFYRRRSR